MDNNGKTKFGSKTNMSKELSENLDDLSLELPKDKETVEQEVKEQQKHCYEISVLNSGEEGLSSDKEIFIGMLN